MSKKDVIIKAAAKLFHEKSFHGTSIGDIANEVGMPKGGLYYYIANKEQLLFEVSNTGVRSLLPVLRKLQNSSLGSREKLLEAVKADVKVLATYREYASVFLKERASLTREHYIKHTADRDEVERIFCAIIEEGVKGGVFRQVDIKLTVFAILGMCNWLTQWYQPQGEVSANDIGELFADAAERILKPDH